jgi:hypothetical protein
MKTQKSRTIILVILLVIIAACIYGIVSPSDSEKDTGNETEPVSTEVENSKDETETTQENTTAAEPQETTGEDKTVKEGSYDIDGMDIIFSDSVRNDVTGNWRMAKVTGNKSTEEYALDYYKELFSDDSEVHAVVNFTLNTTSCITCVGGKINVRIYEYVDGEEHDAKALFGGTKYAEYNIDIETGKIETAE